MKIKNLKSLREAKGVSQTKCATDTGIPVKTIKRYDRGENVGRIEYAYILARYFERRLDEILEEE